MNANPVLEANVSAPGLNHAIEQMNINLSVPVAFVVKILTQKFLWVLSEVLLLGVTQRWLGFTFEYARAVSHLTRSPRVVNSYTPDQTTTVLAGKWT